MFCRLIRVLPILVGLFKSFKIFELERVFSYFIKVCKLGCLQERFVVLKYSSIFWMERTKEIIVSYYFYIYNAVTIHYDPKAIVFVIIGQLIKKTGWCFFFLFIWLRLQVHTRFIRNRYNTNEENKHRNK